MWGEKEQNNYSSIWITIERKKYHWIDAHSIVARDMRHVKSPSRSIICHREEREIWDMKLPIINGTKNDRNQIRKARNWRKGKHTAIRSRLRPSYVCVTMYRQQLWPIETDHVLSAAAFFGLWPVGRPAINDTNHWCIWFAVKPEHLTTHVQQAEKNNIYRVSVWVRGVVVCSKSPSTHTVNRRFGQLTNARSKKKKKTHDGCLMLLCRATHTRYLAFSSFIYTRHNHKQSFRLDFSRLVRQTTLRVPMHRINYE